jgi:tripartite-type tricarboxylate transporter receptor subunit TctC
MTIKTILAGTALALGLAGHVAAQGYPDRQVNYIIPFNAGGESDVAARLQQPVFERLTGQPMVIQYMAGAGGAQAWSQLNTMEADGYTLMGTNLPHIILQPMAQDVGYETDDIANVYFFQYTPHALLVPADSPFQTLEDVVAFARENPAALTVGGSASRSANEVAKVQFDEAAGITTTYIPFSGTAPSMAALAGGQVSAGFSYTTAALAQGDNVRALAVATEERVPALPDVPTFRELGYDIVGGAYRGVGVPSDTPEEVREEISDALDAVNEDPDFVQRMEDGGFVVIDVPYAEVPAFLEERRAEYEAVAEKFATD